MKTLPPPETLAGLVSNVTQTMLGISFAPDNESAPAQQLQWRTAVLPIPGARPVTVGLSSDQHGCAALGAAMFSCSPDTVDASMINDSLSELVNMTAGLVKSVLGLDQALGLPRITESTVPLESGSSQVVLRAKDLGLLLWVREGIL